MNKFTAQSKTNSQSCTSNAAQEMIALTAAKLSHTTTTKMMSMMMCTCMMMFSSIPEATPN